MVRRCPPCGVHPASHLCEAEKIFDYLCNRAVFCLFFFSRVFHENFKFLKNCQYDFHKNLHSHSKPKGAPVLAKASTSYDWNVRSMAKISPKMAKISPKMTKISPRMVKINPKSASHFSLFFDFLKNCPYDSNENF